MAPVLNDKSLVTVTLAACEALLKKHDNHTLYYFLEIGAGASCEWCILPQHEIVTFFQGWSGEDKATVNEWLAGGGFRAFMTPRQRARFNDPIVDCVDGKLVIRSGKKKTTLLE